MPQFTISGESLDEIDELSTRMKRAEGIAESELFNVFEDVILVKDALKEMSNGSTFIRRREIEDQVDAEVYQILQLLQAYGHATSSGRGGSWTHTGD